MTALPMGAISTLLSLQANAPQYVIQHYLGVAAVGTFAALAYPFLLGNIVVTAMGQAASSLFADALGRSDTRPSAASCCSRRRWGQRSAR